MRTKLALTLFLLFPLQSFAAVKISEVMYDLEGTDTGREWIEVVNDGASSIDISGFKLFEANANHSLTLASGNPVLTGGGYAIIADDAQKFLQDHSSYTGTLFESSFSLSNTGEALAIRNGALVEEDSISYSSEQGGQGDGQTLHRSGAAFVAGAATPGSGQSSSSGSSAASVTEEPETEPTGAAQTTPRITAYAGEDRKVVVGADTVFKADAFGTDGAPLLNARYVWSFGDGTLKEGKYVLHAFIYPGKYVVILSVSSADWSASDRVVVDAAAAELSVRSETDGSVSVFNRSGQDVDIGGWFISRGGASFALPGATVILARSGIRLHPSLTRLPATGDLQLLYPNGSLAAIDEGRTGSGWEAEGLIERIPLASPRIVPAVLGAETKEPEPSESAPMLTSIPAIPPREQSSWPWYLALAVTAGIGAVGVWYIRRASRPLADQFEIIDISEKQDR